MGNEAATKVYREDAHIGGAFARWLFTYLDILYNAWVEYRFTHDNTYIASCS